MTDKEIDFITTRLKPEFNMLEWGGGNSTKIFSPFVKRYVSIEHDEEWYDKIKGFAEVHLVKPNLDWQGEDDGSYEQFEDYVNKVKDFDIVWDAVLVDGRAREACLKELLNHINTKTLVFLHDAERHKTYGYRYFGGVDKMVLLKK